MLRDMTDRTSVKDCNCNVALDRFFSQSRRCSLPLWQNGSSKRQGIRQRCFPAHLNFANWPGAVGAGQYESGAVVDDVSAHRREFVLRKL